MRDYTAMTAKELSELQQRHRQELQEKKAKIERRKICHKELNQEVLLLQH